MNELCSKNKVSRVDAPLIAPVICSTQNELDAEVGSDKKRSRSKMTGSLDLSLRFSIRIDPKNCAIDNFQKDLDWEKWDLLPNSGWMLESGYSIERLNELC